MGGYGELIGAGIGATASHINLGASQMWQERNARDSERVAAMQRELLRQQLYWQRMIQSGQVQKERFNRDIGMVDRAEAKQQGEQAKSYQMEKQKLNEVLGMINRSPQLRERTIQNMRSLGGM